MPLSKRRRFEIFKRDGFTCQYCGNRPPEVVLEVDHINPRANGGDDDELNLITACWDCNSGKSDKKLGDVSPKPDADLAFLEAQQELAEARRYLLVKEARDEAWAEVAYELNEVIKQAFRWSLTDYQAAKWAQNWRQLLTVFAPEEIEDAIRIVGPRYRGGLLKDESDNGIIRYMAGVMRNRRAT